jgi:hypothetical protein
MKTEKGLTRNEIINQLSKSPHGKLTEYLAVGQEAAKQEGEFLAHLIAWDRVKGQIRDSKTALPVVSLSVPAFPEELVENSLAHLALLPPRELVKAVRFALEVKVPGRMQRVKRLVESYLRTRESNWPKWERMVVQHKASVRELYALLHIKPLPSADLVLFKGFRPVGSLFADIAALKDMTPAEAAGTIMERKIPFLIARGAMGAKAKDPDVVLALMERMTPTELVTNTRYLEGVGVKTNPALRAAFEAGLTKAATSKKATLKTTRAAESEFIEDEGLKAKLRGLQEKQLQALGGVDGNWLVLGDCSGSMTTAIEAARQIAATLARMVKGNVHLIFFNTSPRYINATGKTYEELKKATRLITATGGTSIGCGLQYALDAQFDIDGIAVVSDGGENHLPWFTDVYRQYTEKFGKEPPVYLYLLNGETDVFSVRMGLVHRDVQKFDLRGNVDYYSLPNTVQTMRVNRYSLVDEIMAAPLLTLEEVLRINATGKH